jgi:GNAT superfamily N-acetyltransferase
VRSVQVTTWTLEMRTPPLGARPPIPAGVRIEVAPAISPEYARFLYALVGGPWHWVDRLTWSRQEWLAEIARSEFHVAYAEGVPAGYVQLFAEDSSVEIRYFGLTEAAIGRGLGGALLAYGVDQAWSLPQRHEVEEVVRVWVHTCTLDGPAALANYQRRGFEIVGEVTAEEERPADALGAWTSTTGLVC